MSTCETAALLSVYFERIVLNLNIKYRETYDKTTEGKIRELIEDSSNSSDPLLGDACYPMYRSSSAFLQKTSGESFYCGTAAGV